MYYPIDDAKRKLPKFWLVLSMFTAMVIALFMFPLFKDEIETLYILKMMAAGAGVGFFVGMHVTFRSRLGSGFGLGMFCYLVVSLEILMTGGAAGLAMHIAGRPDLQWVAFFTNLIGLSIALFGGIHLEAKSLGAINADEPHRWKKEIEKYVDYPSRTVLPSLSNGQGLSQPKADFFTSPYAIMAVGSANIPLFFDLYGGGRMNAIYLALPLMAGALIYLNFKNFGPSLVRLFLLRKLEKSVGYRFINADYEQIQDLRRTFFLSRWLMKDYVKPAGKAATNGAVQRK